MLIVIIMLKQLINKERGRKLAGQNLNYAMHNNLLVSSCKMSLDSRFNTFSKIKQFFLASKSLCTSITLRSNGSKVQRRAMAICLNTKIYTLQFFCTFCFQSTCTTVFITKAHKSLVFI